MRKNKNFYRENQKCHQKILKEHWTNEEICGSE